MTGPSALVTADHFDRVMAEQRAEVRADMYRALWLFGTGIVAALGVIIAVVNALD